MLTRKHFGALPISMSSESTTELRIWLPVDVPYFLWNGSISSYKHIKIWGVGVYIINRHATRKNIYDISYSGYFMRYAATTGVIIYWKPYKNVLSTEPIVFDLMNIIIIYP